MGLPAVTGAAAVRHSCSISTAGPAHGSGRLFWSAHLSASRLNIPL